jgi:hypothetical protein
MPDLIGKVVNALLYPGGWYLFVRIITASYAMSAIGRLLPIRRKQVPGYRRRPARAAALTTAGVAVVCGAAACAYVLPPHRSPAPVAPAAAAVAGTSTPEVGVFEPDEWKTWKPVQQFAAAVGRKPGIVLLYSGWPEPWQAKFAAMAYANGAVPFVQIEPVGVSLESIVAGHSDTYLRSYAASVRRYGHQVILSFAAEMNGTWYSWGAGHTKPSVFVAAWQHVVRVFREAGARNVTWLWTVNSVNASSGPLKAWWPGHDYVDLVGIDGYYYRPADTFGSVFGTTLAELRTFTQAPVLISETAVGPAAGASKIAALFAGIRNDRIRGIVWFDQAQHAGIYHQDWRLEDSPGALAAFRKAANG